VKGDRSGPDWPPARHRDSFDRFAGFITNVNLAGGAAKAGCGVIERIAFPGEGGLDSLPFKRFPMVTKSLRRADYYDLHGDCSNGKEIGNRLQMDGVVLSEGEQPRQVRRMTNRTITISKTSPMPPTG
jgi:hypothetical protein